MKFAPLFVVLLVAAPARAAQHKKNPATRAHAAKKLIVPVVTAPIATPASISRDAAVLSASGLALSEDRDGLLAAATWPETSAAVTGLRDGDRVWRVNQAEAGSFAAAASACRETPVEQRLSLVVRRGLESAALSGAPTPAPADFVRGDRDLSAREKNLAAARAARDVTAARDAVAETAPLDWTLRADQAFWVRFPGGLPAGLAREDEVVAEVTTGLTTDGTLDFLAVPPKTRAWAKVVSASDDSSVRVVRLAFYKIRPDDAAASSILGAATALAGVPSDLARVSAGGTFVVAVPLPPADGKKRRGKDLLLDEDARVRVRLTDPVILTVPPSWWRAGPGLWLKTSADAAGRRRFQLTHLVAGRSAAAAGLKVGDMLDAVGGRSAERLDFEEALDALYGPPGSTVKVSIDRGGKSETLTLTRGVKVDAKGAATPLPLPFETR